MGILPNPIEGPEALRKSLERFLGKTPGHETQMKIWKDKFYYLDERGRARLSSLQNRITEISDNDFSELDILTAIQLGDTPRMAFEAVDSLRGARLSRFQSYLVEDKRSADELLEVIQSKSPTLGFVFGVYKGIAEEKSVPENQLDQALDIISRQVPELRRRVLEVKYAEPSEKRLALDGMMAFLHQEGTFSLFGSQAPEREAGQFLNMLAGARGYRARRSWKGVERE